MGNSVMETQGRAEIKWYKDGIEYTIKNIPYQTYDEVDTCSLGTMIKIELIMHLMHNNEVPKTVNFKKVEDLKIDL